MTDESATELRVALRRAGGPGEAWTGHVYDGALLIAEGRADSPGELLEELAIELDRRETEAIVAARRLRGRQDNAGD